MRARSSSPGLLLAIACCFHSLCRRRVWILRLALAVDGIHGVVCIVQNHTRSVGG